MRIPIFRGRHVSAGAWIYGSLIVVEEKTYILPIGVKPITFHYFEVESETVGEDTGMRDNTRTKKFPDGQPIFEGDVLSNSKREKESFAIVEWGKEEAGFYLYDNWTGHTIYPPLEGIFIKIGNIHDNPELAKDDE
jgi:hypothetical protein